jgi:predicted nucleotidyltransferase
MATGNYRDYLKQATVRTKKHLNVLRPLLACEVNSAWDPGYRV